MFMKLTKGREFKDIGTIFFFLWGKKPYTQEEQMAK